MWVPQIRDYRRYYRHLLAGPYRIFRAHRAQPENALILLGGPFGPHGEVVEQFASRLEIVTNRGLIESLTTLYWDAAGRKLRRGAGGKEAGSARRLADVLEGLGRLEHWLRSQGRAGLTPCDTLVLTQAFARLARDAHGVATLADDFLGELHAHDRADAQ